MTHPFRVGIIGAGGVGQRQMRLLKALGGVELVAVADLWEPNLTNARASWGVQGLYSDYRKLLKEHPEIDAISICTPNHLHAENALAALEAGKHVLVEKPMAMNAREAQAMLDAARHHGRRLIVGFQYRFSPRTRVIRRQIETGQFGRILYVRAQSLRRRGIPNWGTFGRREIQGGGAMMDVGVHVLETAHYLIGSPRPVAATGGTWTYHGNRCDDVMCQWPNWDHRAYDVEDLAVGMVRFENGALLTLESSFVAHIKEDVWNVTILGEKGGATWETPMIFKDDGGYMMDMTPSYIGEWNDWEYKMRHFVEVCRDGRPNESPGEHGVLVQKMLDGIYQSAAAGQEIKIE